MICHPPGPVVRAANFFLSKATATFSSWEPLRPFRTKNLSPYSLLHSRDTIFATTSSAQEKSIAPIPEKSRTMRDSLSSLRIRSMVSRIRRPRDRPVISFVPFLKSSRVSFFKKTVLLYTSRLQLVQLKHFKEFFWFLSRILSETLWTRSIRSSKDGERSSCHPLSLSLIKLFFLIKFYICDRLPVAYFSPFRVLWEDLDCARFGRHPRFFRNSHSGLDLRLR